MHEFTIETLRIKRGQVNNELDGARRQLQDSEKTYATNTARVKNLELQYAALDEDLREAEKAAGK